MGADALRDGIDIPARLDLVDATRGGVHRVDLDAGASWAATARGRSLQVAADVAMVLVATFVTWRWALHNGAEVSNPLLLWTFTPAAYLFVFARLRLYHARMLVYALEELRRILYGSLLSAMVVDVIVFDNTPDARRHALALFGSSLVLLTFERRATRRYFSWRRGRGLGARRTVLVGSGHDCDALASVIDDNPDLGYRIATRVAATRSSTPNEIVREVLAATQRYGASDVLLAEHSLDGVATKVLVRELQHRGVRVEVSSGLSGIDPTRLTLGAIGGKPVLHFEPTVQRGWKAWAKRAFDVGVASFSLVCLSPAVLVAAVAIWFTDRGPVFFRQPRVGKDGDGFAMLKLRTMVPNAEARLADLRASNEADGPMFKMRHDPRITRVGRWLRKLSIDEIPQLWNVIKGDMSLVGPRPALPAEVEQWEPEVRERLRVKPGITGMWQVSGRSSCSFDDYVRLDLYYVDNWSLVYDLAILAKTVPVVLKSSGAF